MKLQSLKRGFYLLLLVIRVYSYLELLELKFLLEVFQIRG